MPDQAGVRAKKEPRVTAVYLKNVQGGPIGTVRRSLRESLPSWALLGLSFLGGSILEVVTADAQKARLVHTMRLMGIQELTAFSIFDDSLKKLKSGIHNDERTRRNVEKVQQRMRKIISGSQSMYAWRWYDQQLQEAERRLDALPRTAMDASKGTQHNQTSPGEEGWVLVTGRGKRATTSKTERTPSGTLEGATVEQEDDVAMTTTQRPSKATTRPKDTKARQDGETGPSPPGDRPDQGEL